METDKEIKERDEFWKRESAKDQFERFADHRFKIVNILGVHQVIARKRT